jgi:glycosyltransferase involved in cell wall biosynthesis
MLAEARTCDVSLIMPVRDEAPYISKAVESVLRQHLNGLEWELLVADGASADGTREILERYAAERPEIRIIDNPERTVPCGLNRAILAARGRVVLRIDAHTEYEPDYARACIETLERTGAQNVGGPARTKAEGIVPQAIAAAYHSPFGCGGARFHDVNYEGPVDTVTYGCWKRTTLFDVGLFDELFVRNQDDELNLRITRGGGLIWQTPQAVSWYRPRATLKSLYRQYFQYGFWKFAVLRKHRIPASWRHLVPGAFLFWLSSTALAATLGRLAEAPAITLTASVLLGLALAVYAAVAVLAALWYGRKHGAAVTALLPLVFATYHFSYGLGFLSGIIFPPKAGTRQHDYFTRLSR